MPSSDKQYKYIDIERVDFGPGKTSRWIVWSKSRANLGTIKWYSHWRCYSFFPHAGTLYEHNCLWDIADFVARETTANREGWKKKKCPVQK